MLFRSLTQYYQGLGVRVRYLHSDIETLERVQILRDLRKGEFDVLVGINLLREGLDLPEVSLVAILDADKEGFLRSGGSLIQTSGRAARNVNGRVIMYADMVTESMRLCISETERRRALQQAYNAEHGITPQSVVRQLDEVMSSVYERDYTGAPTLVRDGVEVFRTQEELDAHVAGLQEKMKAAAANLDFEKAASLRDERDRETIHRQAVLSLIDRAIAAQERLITPQERLNRLIEEQAELVNAGMLAEADAMELVRREAAQIKAEQSSGVAVMQAGSQAFVAATARREGQEQQTELQRRSLEELKKLVKKPATEIVVMKAGA